MKQWRISAAALLIVAVQGAAHAATVTRTTTFEYDPVTGLLTKEIAEPDNPQLRLETAYGYDARGNQNTVTISSPATGLAAIETRTNTTIFDNQGQFPATITNATGHIESRIYDPKFGGITSLTGPNGLKTQWQYDSLGRKTLEIRADGTRTKWQYLYCNGVNSGTSACPTLAKYLIQTTPLATDGVTPNGPWSKTYFDEYNRAIQFETLGFDSVSVVTTRTVYDKLGRISQVSRPYYSTQTQQWTTFTYDDLNRTLGMGYPDGTGDTFDYNGLTTTKHNTWDQTRIVVRDSQGNTVKVTDEGGASIAYKYDPFGNLLQTTDPNGNSVTFTYDTRGRKIKMVDPDMGISTYDVDALGQTVRRTDAKTQVTTMAYDKLGRMKNRTEADLVSNWTYDSCTMGFGKLCNAKTDNGYSRTVSYDSLGRGSSSATVMDATYNTSVSFDANGRVATRTYPTGFSVKYVYTSIGYLKEVRNNVTNALYWRADAEDVEGNLLQQTYGNNVVTQTVYDPATALINNIYAGAGNSVLNLSYRYDDLHDLISRTDANQNLTETFQHNALHQLWSSTVNSGGAGVVTVNYDYDGIGNMTARSDVGTFTLGWITRPHSITELGLNSGGKWKYSYDANGNLAQEDLYDSAGNFIPNKGRAHIYTSFNMPQALGASGISLAFVYGPEHQRAKQIAPSATTIYVHPDQSGGLLYEKDLKADGTTEHRHFITAGGQVIAIVKQIGSGQSVRYLHHDNLNSVAAITDESGVVVERLAYEPFGKRRFPAGNADTNNTISGINTDRGFTEHEHLDELGLIHMNGRIYNPMTAHFMSADPNITHPFDLISYNRYAYVNNSPLRYTDPSGYDYIISPAGALDDRSIATYVVTGDGNNAASVTSGSILSSIILPRDISIGSGLNLSNNSALISGVQSGNLTLNIQDNSALISGVQSGNLTLTIGGSLITGSTGSMGTAPPSAPPIAVPPLAVPPLAGTVATLPEYTAADTAIATIASGLGASVIAAGILTGDSQQRPIDYLTYSRFNPYTGETYFGRTSGYSSESTAAILGRRAAGQPLLNLEQFDFPVLDRRSSNYDAIRGREQQGIDFYGGARSVGGTARNSINGVADWNPNRPWYIAESVREFGALPDNSPTRPRFGPEVLNYLRQFISK